MTTTPHEPGRAAYEARFAGHTLGPRGVAEAWEDLLPVHQAIWARVEEAVRATTSTQQSTDLTDDICRIVGGALDVRVPGRLRVLIRHRLSAHANEAARIREALLRLKNECEAEGKDKDPGFDAWCSWANQLLGTQPYRSI